MEIASTVVVDNEESSDVHLALSLSYSIRDGIMAPTAQELWGG